MNEKSKKNIDWIDTAKGICILLVIFYHVVLQGFSPSILETATWGSTSSSIYDRISAHLTPLRMPLFFLVSGYLVQKNIKFDAWNTVVQKRIVNLIYLFILWGVIKWLTTAIIDYFNSETIFSSAITNSSDANSLKDFFILMSRGSNNLWYLYSLPLYFIICKILSPKPIIAIIFFFIMQLIAKYYVDEWPSHSILDNAIFYGIGCFYGNYLVSVISKTWIRKISILILLILLTLIARKLDIFKTFSTSIVFVFMIVVFLAWMQNFLNLEWLKWIGKNTLQIYVLHTIIIKILNIFIVPELINTGYFKLGTVANLWVAFYPILATAAVTLISLLLWFILDRGIGIYLFKSPRIIGR
jgi:uncharacterized membrane protein YcfT